MLDGAGSVAVSVSKNSSHSTSGNDVAASLVTSGNGGSDTSNLPSPNNSEEPLPPELLSAPVPAQVSAPHSSVTCLHGPHVSTYVQSCELSMLQHCQNCCHIAYEIVFAIWLF